MKKLIITLLGVLISAISLAQSNCEEIKDTKLVELLESKYKENPIEGAKYVFIDSCKFLIGVGITSTSSKNVSVMNRVASVKARRGVLLLLNNPKVTSETTIQTEQIISESNTEFIEHYFDKIKEEASGFVNGMETLTAFKSSDGSNYIYIIVQPL